MRALKQIAHTGLPLFRWVGGKQRLAKLLKPRITHHVKDRIYIEPFLGSGSFFFSLTPTVAILSDNNQLLIDCYECIRDNPDAVWRSLSTHIAHNSEKYYYLTRDAFNNCNKSASQAARFIYLNRTCFNGVFRVNTKGVFNVPYGHKRRPIYPNKNDILQCSQMLHGATLNCHSYAEAFSRINKDSFVFLDPPYPPLDDTAYFRHYTRERFEESDQFSLSLQVRTICERGGLFLLTLPDNPKVRRSYKGYIFNKVNCVRYVSCRIEKRVEKEIIISNFEY
ncbi:DNA adenine methylase [soil metagenome]